MAVPSTAWLRITPYDSSAVVPNVIAASMSAAARLYWSVPSVRIKGVAHIARAAAAASAAWRWVTAKGTGSEVRVTARSSPVGVSSAPASAARITSGCRWRPLWGRVMA